MRQPGEPSVEEILESIKKVIARDSREAAADLRRQREPRVPAQEVPDPVTSAPATPAPDTPLDVLDLAVSARFLDDEAEGAPTEPADEPLVTAESRSAMRESLAALAMMAEPRAQPKLVRSGETSLEDLVRELLRPALAEWLDANLPEMVERLVASEIARIVGKKP
jgi:cell pole-organizing protein PopZ